MELIILLAVGILAILMAFSVLFQNPKNLVNRLFFANATMLSLWTIIISLFILSQNSVESIAILRFYIILTSLFPLSLVVSGYNFPFKAKKQPVFLYSVILVISILFISIGNATLNSLQSLSFDFYGYNNLSVVDDYLGFSAIFLQIGVSISALFSLLSLNKYKKRLKNSPIYTIITSSIFASIALGMIFNLIAVIFWKRYDLSVTFGNFSIWLLLAAHAIGIWKFGFYDSRSAAIKTVSYAFAEIIIIVLYYMSRELIGANKPGEISEFGLATGIFLTSTSVIIFIPIANFANKIFKKFFDKRTNIDNFLRKLNHTLAQDTDLNILLKKLSYDICNVLGSKNVYFYVKYGVNSEKKIISGKNPPLSIPKSDIDYLDQISPSSKDLLITPNWTNDGAEDSNYRMFKSHGWHFVIPLQTSSGIVGYMFIGEPRGVRYRHSDINVIVETYNSLMIAINSAISIYTVREINSTLEQRIANATKDLRRVNHNLRKTDESKDEFISMASHQLRTPLTSIKGYISMILDGDAGKINKTQETFLTEAFTSSDRMVHIINDFLNVSRLQTGKFVLDKTSSNLNGIVKQEIEGLNNSASARGLKLEFSSDETPDIVADFDKIRQVIMNMIDNAIYYSKPNHPIKISLLNKGDRVEFIVKDSGIGVPKKEQEGLFSKFYRASNARRQRPDGTGVGLFLARKVVLEHGGDVIFESEEGRGSTFGFWLPINNK